MLLKSLQLTLSNLRNISHAIDVKSCLIVPCKKYARFAPRMYTDIENADELFDIEENTTPPILEVQKKPRSKKSKAIDAKQREEASWSDDVKEAPKKERNLISTKIYNNEKIITSLMMSIKTKKQKNKKNRIIIEGTRLIEEGIKVGLVPEIIIFSRYEDIQNLPIKKNETQFYKVPYRVIQLWSTLTTTPGVMAIFEKPNAVEVTSTSLPITIICDNIRDPRNMGAILRAAAGAGCEKVLLSKGCVDFWDAKVLRAAAGAQFRIPIFGAQTWDDIKSSISTDANVFIADSNVNPFKRIEEETIVKPIIHEKKKKHEILEKLNELEVVPYYTADYTKNEIVLIVGGETEGLSIDSVELTKSRNGVRVNIPLNNNIDSLNAGMAVGIIVFEVKKQFSIRVKDLLQ
ncbi:PREDICTED: rRNA methyltransferase 3, mitochondrial [Ceratosolen solmsi marchali]|uniref:rRNA methyltransferase 3, mitochondrial n=1 Tax=Ceratosolen solmsi marchali TaxID=326594 RepID=A0AAJ6YFN9_9HYME|nr:PREDICTED: rRNA methyltransferase 3, mitochondrial [Ceratosolen solmsi marchali]